MRRVRALLVGITVAALFATGCEWNFETLDGESIGPHGQVDGVVGTYNSAMLYNGRPHVFYYDASNGHLRHAYDNGSFWVFEILDGAGGTGGRVISDTGYYNAAMLYNGRPHIFYRDDGSETLRHAYWNGTAWAFETLDGQGGSGGRVTGSAGVDNAAVLYNGRPHIFYGAENDLRHAYWNGIAWAFETLDGQGGTGGRLNANVGFDNAAMLYNGRPHVFYYDASNGDLRHGYWNGIAWAFETLDGSGGAGGRLDSGVGEYGAAILYNGRPHVFYSAGSTNDLRHGYYNGQAWAFETLDGHQTGPNGQLDTAVGWHNSALLYGGGPQVFYRDVTSGDLRRASYNGTAWAFETLDGHSTGPNGRINGTVGRHNAALLVNGLPHNFYFAQSGGTLRHAYFG